MEKNWNEYFNKLPAEIQTTVQYAVPRGIRETEVLARRYAPDADELRKRRNIRLAKEKFERLPEDMQKNVRMQHVLGRATLHRRLGNRDQQEHDRARQEFRAVPEAQHIAEIQRRREEFARMMRSRSPRRHHRR